MTSGPKSSLTPLEAGGLQEGELEIGHIAGVFGVRGEVRLHLHNRDSTLLEQGAELLMIADGERYVITIRSRPGAGRRILGRIDGLNDRTEAEQLIGALLVVQQQALPEPGPGEYYLDEVIGMQVRCGEELLGEVVAVHTTGPVEVFELEGGRYLPSTAENLLSIDRTERIIDVPEGAVAV